MRKLQRVIIFFTLVLMLCSQSIVVFAGAEWGSLDETAQTNAKNLYAYLKLAGYSDYAAAGICGNSDQEYSLLLNEGNDSRYGYFECDEKNWNSYKSWCSDSDLDYKDIVNNFKFIEATRLEGDFTGTTTITLDDYKACTDIITGTEGFMVAYERCVKKYSNTDYYMLQKIQNKSGYGPYRYQQGDERIKYATSIYEALVGTAPADSSASSEGSSADSTDNTNQSQEQVKQQLLASGYYTEEQLSSYIKLQETNIDEQYLTKATRDNLGQSDLENLASWEDNVSNSKKEYGFIAWMRIIVMWVGIIFTIYIFLLYLAYWFDKLNSIIDLDVLSIMTFGRLHVAIDDKEANFSLGKKQDRMTVNHKDMLFICITGLIFGTLLITGTFYKIVASFVNTILRWIG